MLHCCGPRSVSLQSSGGLGRGWRCLGSTHQKLPPPPSPGTGHVQLDWLTRPVQTLVQFQACRLSSATETVCDDATHPSIPRGTVTLAPKVSTAGRWGGSGAVGWAWPTTGPCRHLLLAGLSAPEREQRGPRRCHPPRASRGWHSPCGGERRSQEKGEVVAWSWQRCTSAPFLWPKQVTWSVQIQGVGNGLCAVTKGVGREEGRRIGVVLTISPEAACCQERTRSTLLSAPSRCANLGWC